MDVWRFVAAALGAALAAAPALAQRAPAFAPAEPVPAEHAGSDWRDSRGCLFVRGTSEGLVVWLPVLDAERRQVCDPALALPVPEGAAPATDLAADPAPPVVPPAAGIAPPVQPAAPAPPPAPPPAPALAEDPAPADPEPRAPVVAEVPPIPPPPRADPLDALARLADTAAAPAGRLLFVEPDDRVRLVFVTLPAVLQGDRDPFGVNLPLRGAAVHPAVRRAGLIGYHPQPIRLSAAPPIRGFGPDPMPARWQVRR